MPIMLIIHESPWELDMNQQYLLFVYLSYLFSRYCFTLSMNSFSVRDKGNQGEKAERG